MWHKHINVEARCHFPKEIGYSAFCPPRIIHFQSTNYLLLQQLGIFHHYQINVYYHCKYTNYFQISTIKSAYFSIIWNIKQISSAETSYFSHLRWCRQALKQALKRKNRPISPPFHLFYRHNALHINTLTHVFQISRFKSAYFSQGTKLYRGAPVAYPSASCNGIATTQTFSEIKWCLKPKQTTVALRFKKHFHCKTV